MIVVDYGAGNLRSVETALRHLEAGFSISSSPDEVSAAERLIVPGVGEARAAMERLSASGLDQAIDAFRRAGRPLLGICLGCQIIFERSDERSAHCLGFLPGTVRRFTPGPGRKVPHMGWNRVFITHPHPLFAEIADGAFFYFVHSYYPDPSGDEFRIATTEYGITFASGIEKDNLIAFQFHPEKSGKYGLKLIDNFAKMKR